MLFMSVRPPSTLSSIVRDGAGPNSTPPSEVTEAPGWIVTSLLHTPLLYQYWSPARANRSKGTLTVPMLATELPLKSILDPAPLAAHVEHEAGVQRQRSRVVDGHLGIGLEDGAGLGDRGRPVDEQVGAEAARGERQL